MCKDSTTPMPESKRDEKREISIEMEKYYAVYYDNEFYIGRLVKEDGEYFTFKFLHRLRQGDNKLYDWPQRPDTETIHGKYVFGGPLKLIGTGPFVVNNLHEIEALYHRIKTRSQTEQ